MGYSPEIRTRSGEEKGKTVKMGGTTARTIEGVILLERTEASRMGKKETTQEARGAKIWGQVGGGIKRNRLMNIERKADRQNGPLSRTAGKAGAT